MTELIHSLFAEAPHLLLFLKSVARIEFHRWLPDRDAPELQFGVSVAALSDSLRARRGYLTTVKSMSEIKETIELADTVDIAMDVSAAYQHSHSLSLEHKAGDAKSASDSAATANDAKADSKADDSSGGGQRTITETWLIVNRLDAGAAKAMAVQPEHASYKFIPFGGVAARIARDKQPLLDEAQQLVGKAFCFLPLPISTGFPVHVSAVFSSRDHVRVGRSMDSLSCLRIGERADMPGCF